jgi:chemotaxis protein CheD
LEDIGMAQKLVNLMECVVTDSGTLKINRIGVGVGVILHSKSHKTAAGLHVLAANSASPKPDNPAKYANTAIPYALDELNKKGVQPPLTVSVVGGGSMPGVPPEASMGPKVVSAVKEALLKAGLSVQTDRTGGSKIVSMIFDVETGKMNMEATPAAISKT